MGRSSEPTKYIINVSLVVDLSLLNKGLVLCMNLENIWDYTRIVGLANIND